MAIWSDLPEYSSIYIGVASLFLLCNSSVEVVKSLPSSHFELSFCNIKFWTNMASKRSKPHPDLPMVRLRPWVDDIDIPDIHEFQIPADFGK